MVGLGGGLNCGLEGIAMEDLFPFSSPHQGLANDIFFPFKHLCPKKQQATKPKATKSKRKSLSACSPAKKRHVAETVEEKQDPSYFPPCTKPELPALVTEMRQNVEDNSRVMVDVAELIQLVRLCSSPKCCPSGNLVWTKSNFIGCNLKVELTCANCRNTFNWQSCEDYHTGKKYPDLKGNRDVVASALCCGGEESFVREFFKLLGLGLVSHDLWSKTQAMLAEVVDKRVKAEDTTTAKWLATLSEIAIGVDTQYSRSHRKTGSAPFATTTAIIVAGPAKRMLVEQVHVDEEVLEKHKRTRTQSKEVLGLEILLESLASKLPRIDYIASDGCTSMDRIMKEKVLDKHPQCKLAQDLWHAAKCRDRQWDTFINQHTGKRKTKVYTYEDIRRHKEEISAGSLRGIFYGLVKQYAPHDLEGLKKAWINEANTWAADFPDISKASIDALRAWLTKETEDFDLNLPDLATSDLEAFHSLCSKIYFRKGSPLGFDSYKLRRGLAALHWEESICLPASQAMSCGYRWSVMLDLDRHIRSLSS